MICRDDNETGKRIIICCDRASGSWAVRPAAANDNSLSPRWVHHSFPSPDDIQSELLLENVLLERAGEIISPHFPSSLSICLCTQRGKRDCCTTTYTSFPIASLDHKREGGRSRKSWHLSRSDAQAKKRSRTRNIAALNLSSLARSPSSQGCVRACVQRSSQKLLDQPKSLSLSLALVNSLSLVEVGEEKSSDCLSIFLLRLTSALAKKKDGSHMLQ